MKLKIYKGKMTEEDEVAIYQELVRSGYNLSKTAAALGICYESLVYRLVAMGIYVKVVNQRRSLNARPLSGNIRHTSMVNEIKRVLADFDYNIDRTARALGVCRKTAQKWANGHFDKRMHIHEGTHLWFIERDLILSALAKHNGNRTFAAIELGMSVRNLRLKLSQYEEAETD